MYRMGISGNYDPETLHLLQEVLDQVWDATPPERRAEVAKSEMAQRILRRAAEGERDPVKLRAAARVGPA
jgi:hypothetical protein